MKFDTSLLLNLFAAAAMLVMGFRSFSKKHQMKFSDDEERAMWEKKFGVFYFCGITVGCQMFFFHNKYSSSVYRCFNSRSSVGSSPNSCSIASISARACFFAEPGITARTARINRFFGVWDRSTNSSSCVR